jgi:Cu(I)/Ag(I) efflux system membrane fusion protein
MRSVRVSGVLAMVTLVVVAACDGAPPEESPAAATPTEYMAVGTLNSIDAAAGTVNVSHTAVPAAGWPAMTMDFKVAQPADVADLKPGDRVDIHFTVQEGMNATITHIATIQ